MEDPRVLKRWKDARFGLMVHFGLYSLPAGIWKGQEIEYLGEWLQSRFRIPKEDYARLAQDFNPEGFDADEWVAYARAAGMRFMVVTAKHHDGFALFHSKADPFNSVDATPFGRDLIGELAEACRRADFPFGIYYSQTLDWREAHGGGTNSFGLNKGMSWFNDWDFPAEGRRFEEYFDRKCLPQLEELLTQYGPLFELWFDTPLDMPARFSAKILETVRRHQPECMVNSRLGGDYDFEITGDNMIPSTRNSRPTEAPATLNHTWGYKKNDHHWKSSGEIIQTLGRLASLDVNYLMNVGPDGTGRFPEESRKILGEVGDWLRVHGEAIYGTDPTPFDAGVPWANVTRKGSSLYFIIPPGKESEVCLDGVDSAPQNSALLPDRAVPMHQENGSLVFNLPAVEKPSVVKLTFANPPVIQKGLYPQGSRLILDAPLGRITGASTAPGEIGQIDADGNPVSGGGLHLRRGQTFGWSDGGAEMDWSFHLPRAGRYSLMAETGVAWHGQPWQTGIEVEARCGEATLRSRLGKDDMDPSESAREYAHVTSHIGAWDLPSGHLTIHLRPTSIPQGSTGLHLIRLVMERIPSS